MSNLIADPWSASVARCAKIFVSDQITFEHPLNERTRLLMRLAHLFGQLDFFLPQEEAGHSRAAMTALLDIANLLSRTDIKSEIIKELERHISKLSRIRQTPGVDMQRLGQILDGLEKNLVELHRTEGQLGQYLRENEFLKSIMQRSSIPGGNCAFDMPQFHFWLEQPPEARIRQLQYWTGRLKTLQHAVALLVNLIRSSSTPRQELAQQGFFQQGLDAQMPVQLIRVTITKEPRLFAEISGGKHRFTVRFMRFTDDGERPSQTYDDIGFLLTTCVF